MRLLPPLNISAAQADAVCAVISRACEIVEGQEKPGGSTRPVWDATESANLAALAGACSASEACTGSVETCGAGSVAE